MLNATAKSGGVYLYANQQVGAIVAVLVACLCQHSKCLGIWRALGSMLCGIPSCACCHVTLPPSCAARPAQAGL